MYGGMGYGKPWNKQYVMVDFDETASLHPAMFLQIFDLLKRCGFIPKICTARSKDDDNSDIFMHFPVEDVIFCCGKQKRDSVKEQGYKLGDIAFWMDDSPESIIRPKDYDNYRELQKRWHNGL